MTKFRSILVRFRVGSFGGIRGPNITETLEALRQHGFPKELNGEVAKVLEYFRNSRNNKTVSPYTIEGVEEDLLILLGNWQKRRKKGGKDAVLSE